MENQNEKTVDKKAAEVHEKLTDETIDKVTGGKGARRGGPSRPKEKDNKGR